MRLLHFDAYELNEDPNHWVGYRPWLVPVCSTPVPEDFPIEKALEEALTFSPSVRVLLEARVRLNHRAFEMETYLHGLPLGVFFDGEPGSYPAVILGTSFPLSGMDLRDIAPWAGGYATQGCWSSLPRDGFPPQAYWCLFRNLSTASGSSASPRQRGGGGASNPAPAGGSPVAPGMGPSR
jgi:hypothetical protein